MTTYTSLDTALYFSVSPSLWFLRLLRISFSFVRRNVVKYTLLANLLYLSLFNQKMSYAAYVNLRRIELRRQLGVMA